MIGKKNFFWLEKNFFFPKKFFSPKKLFSLKKLFFTGIFFLTSCRILKVWPTYAAGSVSLRKKGIIKKGELPSPKRDFRVFFRGRSHHKRITFFFKFTQGNAVFCSRSIHPVASPERLLGLMHETLFAQRPVAVVELVHLRDVTASDLFQTPENQQQNRPLLQNVFYWLIDWICSKCHRTDKLMDCLIAWLVPTKKSIVSYGLIGWLNDLEPSVWSINWLID